jgi:hypothetical protein
VIENADVYDASLTTPGEAAIGPRPQPRTEAIPLNSASTAIPEFVAYALLGSVRARSPAREGKTPPVALTAYAGTENRGRALAAGFDAHLAKPVAAATLLALVGTLAKRVAVTGHAPSPLQEDAPRWPQGMPCCFARTAELSYP